MRLPGWNLLTARRQLLEPELAHRFQQEISGLTIGTRFLSQEALVNERVNPSDDVNGEAAQCRRDSLDRLDRAAADETRVAAEERLLLGRQQVVAPGDCIAHGLQAHRLIARAACQQSESLIETSQQRLR